MSPFRSLCLVVITAAFLVHCSVQETSFAQDKFYQIRATDQPPQGKCSHIGFGGVSWVHLYVCCNNCNENNGKPICDNTTYHGASKGEYCGHCGTDEGDGWLEFKYFKCGGCTGQAQVQAGCQESYNWIFPGLCWIHSSCFQHRCRELYDSDLGEGRNPSWDIHDEPFCGDDNCGPGENSTNCPFDCCPVSNPAKCERTKGACPPYCCSKSGCCGTSGTSIIKGGNMLILIPISVIARAFISLHY